MRWRRALPGLLGFLAVLLIFAVSPLGFLVVVPVDNLTYRPRALQRAREAEPLVAAIYRYKAKAGRWPEKLADLVPGLLPQLPPGPWEYKPGGDGLPPVLRCHSSLHCYVAYYFPPADNSLFAPGVSAGWLLDREGHWEYLPGP